MNTFIETYLAFSLGMLFLSVYLYFQSSSDIMTKMEVRSFRALVLAFQAYVVIVCLYTLQEHGVLDNLNPGITYYKIICFATLFLPILISFIYYLYIVNHFDLGAVHNTRALLVGLVPIFAVALFLVASIFNGIVFSVDANGKQSSGPLYFIVHVCSLFYFLAIFRIAFSKAKKVGTNQAKRDAMAVSWPIAFILFWIVIDHPLKGTTVIHVAVFAVLLHLFVTSQKSNIYTDTLTGLNNRRKAEIYLANEVKNCSNAEPIYLFMGDINGFKLINDEHGHYEGDCALMIFSEAVKKSASAYDGFAARYGGDEFVWAWRPIKNGDVDPEMVISDIRHRVEAECKAQQRPYVLSLSIGHILCTDPKRTANSYLKEADRIMYADKQGYYRNKR